MIWFPTEEWFMTICCNYEQMHVDCGCGLQYPILTIRDNEPRNIKTEWRHFLLISLIIMIFLKRYSIDMSNYENIIDNEIKAKIIFL